MTEITMEQIMTTIIVLSAVCGGLFAIDKVVDIFKKWRQPSTDIQTKLAADKIRLENHDKQILDLTRMVNALCKAEVAHLTHELTGNGTDKLKDALTMLTNSTIDRLG